LKNPAQSLVALLAVLSLNACASSTGEDEGPTEDSVEQDLAAFRGSSFKAGALSVKLEFKDGVKATTLNKRFIRATVTRGSKSFGAWCSLRGDGAVASKSDLVDCSLGVSTVSNDDDESLAFTIQRSGAASAPTYKLSYDYAGDGTFLGNEFDILAGSGANTDGKLDLSVTKRGTRVENDPFVLADSIHEALGGLLGMRVLDSGLRAKIAAKSYDFSVSDRMDLTLSVGLDANGGRSVTAEKSVSLFATPGSLTSGLASNSTLESRSKAAFR
jgi:hypothetical protein